MEKAIDWVSSHECSDQQTKTVASGIVSETLAHRVPDRTVQFALNQPRDQFDIDPKGLLVEYLAASDIEQALELLLHVRDGTTTLHTYLVVANCLSLQYEFEQALDLGAQLDNDYQQTYADPVFNH